MTNAHGRSGSRARRRQPRSALREGPTPRKWSDRERYAGGKWGEAPAAAALPPPPMHWTALGCRPEPDRARGLKLLLNVA